MRCTASDARATRRRSGQHGMVTAELAACLPVLVLLVAAVLAAVAVVSAHVRAQDAAGEAARAAARDDGVSARRLARQALPGSRLTTTGGAGDVTATVSVTVRPLGGLLPAFHVSEQATAAREPVAAGGSG